MDGILVKREAVVIPQALRPSVKRRLHSAHLGRDSMLRRARGTVYWPNIASDIKQIADMCETCQEMKPRNPPEPLTEAAQWWWWTMAEDWSWFIWNCWKALLGSGRLLLQFHRGWFTHNDDECAYFDVAQETLCSLWHTENDCVERRSTVYESGV